MKHRLYRDIHVWSATIVLRMNIVKDALDGILKAEQDYQNKRSQAEGVFSWLNISDKEIIETNPIGRHRKTHRKEAME